MKQKIRAIVKRVGEDPIESTLVNSLEALQAAVRGYIEVVEVLDPERRVRITRNADTETVEVSSSPVVMLVNEEGLIRENIAFNCVVSTKNGDLPVYGNILFLGIENGGEDGDEFTDCPISLNAVKELIR